MWSLARAHVARPPPEQADTALLHGLPTINMEAPWIPWTHGRLQATSGYGAGVRSPGWYLLISDLYEGGNQREMLRRAAELVQAGVQFIILLALSDDGASAHDYEMAALFSRLGIPCFTCTPDHFPDLMAAAISRQDLNVWAAARGIVTARSAEDSGHFSP